jgi:hypothetical protein
MEILQVDKLIQSPGTLMLLYMGFTKRNLSCDTLLQNVGLCIAVTTALSTPRHAIISWSKTPILCYIILHCNISIMDITHSREGNAYWKENMKLEGYLITHKLQLAAAAPPMAFETKLS